MPITASTDEALAAVRAGFRDPTTQQILLALQRRPEVTQVTDMSPISRLMGMLVGGALGRTTTPWFGEGKQRIQLDFPLHKGLSQMSGENELVRTLGPEGGHVALDVDQNPISPTFGQYTGTPSLAIV